MKAVFDRDYVRRLEDRTSNPAKTNGAWCWKCARTFGACEDNGVDRLVMIWCGSTEIFLEPNPDNDIESLEKAIKENHTSIAPSMIYAYAALQEGVPFLNGAPNLTVDIPAMIQLAKQQGVPIGGKDFKTGQTLMKTILAPGFKARMLGVRGWFSTNILGNRDGEVLDDPYSFKTKEVSKLDVLEYILQPDCTKSYGDIYHEVRINYYPPRGDEKEGWITSISLAGWLPDANHDFRRDASGGPTRPTCFTDLNSAAVGAVFKSGSRFTLKARRPHPTCIPNTISLSS